MKTDRNLSMLLACLASGCCFSSRATAGTLIGSTAAAPATVNLTAEGTLDWIEWNSSNNGGSGPFLDAFDQKIGGTNQISDTSPYGSTNLNGPWTPVTAASPYTATPSARQMFYRVKEWPYRPLIL